MKLILAITRLDAGGMERFCVTLGNTLAAQGRACLVCALHRAAHGASRDWLSPAVDYVELNRPARFAAPALARLCRRNPEAPVLALGVEIAIVLVALKRLGIVRNRIFYRESTAVPAHCSAFWQWLMARFISRTDGLIVPSRQAMTDLQALFPLRQPVALIRNPCAFARPPGSGPAVFPCRRQNMNVLSVGRLEPMKGHERLIRAWPSVRERFSGARLKIAGQGSLFAALNACVASLKLDACVTLSGYLPHPQLAYQEADLFVLPSLYEGLPNALVEALILGCRVVAAAGAGGTVELMDALGLGAFLVPDADFENQLADAIDRALAAAPDVWIEARQRLAAMTAPETVADQVWRFVFESRK